MVDTETRSESKQKILDLLRGTDQRVMSVRDMAGELDLSRPTITKHAEDLAEEGCLGSETVTQTTVYWLIPERTLEIELSEEMSEQLSELASEEGYDSIQAYVENYVLPSVVDAGGVPGADTVQILREMQMNMTQLVDRVVELEEEKQRPSEE